MALTVTVTDRVAHLGPVQQAVQGLGDSAIGQLVLDGKKLDARFDGSVVQDGPLIRSISTATSLAFTVSDPERYLLQGRYFERRADLLFDDLWFRICAMDKAGDQFTMTFQDREVALLSRHKKARRASRAKVTRAEFLRSLVREEPHIAFVCPELHVDQRIAPLGKADVQTQKTAAEAQRKKGIAAREKIKIQGAGATISQIDQINIAMNVAVAHKANELAAMAMLVAGIGESAFRPSATDYATHTHKGVFQSNIIPQYDTKAQAEAFLTGGRSFKAGGAIGAAHAHPDWSPGTIASYVEISNSNGGYYDRFAAEAKAIYKKFGGTGGLVDSNTDGGTYVQQYEYTRGQPAGPKGEDTWTCGQRLADEVGWRWFCVAGVVYFISDNDLIRSMPRMTLNENSRGVDNIDFALDSSAKIPDTVTVTGRASRWAAPPGTVVTLDESMADAAGAWIVTEIERPSLSNNDVTITLSKPKPPHLEPAPTVSTRAPKASSTRDGGLNATPGATGNVTIADGANRAGAALKQHVIDFLQLVAGQTTENITVTTGTQHNQFVMGEPGVQSDHWTGDAADIGVGGDARSDPAAASKGNNIATAALIAVGVDRKFARQWASANETLNFGVASNHDWINGGVTYGVQIGWRTMVGGNHYNHVHIGVHPK